MSGYCERDNRSTVILTSGYLLSAIEVMPSPFTIVMLAKVSTRDCTEMSYQVYPIAV
jgi:hypothetical protein